jgi:hypothetical protein
VVKLLKATKERPT